MTDRPLALVTGASHGIGLELAKQFATNGFDLVAVAEGDRLDPAAEALRALGAPVEVVHADLATHEVVPPRGTGTGTGTGSAPTRAGT